MGHGCTPNQTFIWSARIVRFQEGARSFHVGLHTTIRNSETGRAGELRTTAINLANGPPPHSGRPVPVACGGDIPCDPRLVENLVGHGEDAVFPFLFSPSRHRKTSQRSSGNLVSPSGNIIWISLRFNRVRQPPWKGPMNPTGEGLILASREAGKLI